MTRPLTFARALAAGLLLLEGSFACGGDEGQPAGDEDSEASEEQDSSGSGTGDGNDDTSGGDGDTGTGTGSDDPPEDNYAPCDPVTRVGRFRVKLQPPTSLPGFTSVEGTVQQALDPTDDHATLDTVGACHLVRALEYECDPPCDGATERCAPNLDGTGNICHPRGRNQDAGVVEITGLLDLK